MAAFIAELTGGRIKIAAIRTGDFQFVATFIAKFGAGPIFNAAFGASHSSPSQQSIGLLFGGRYKFKHAFADRHPLNVFESGGRQDFILLFIGEMDAAGTDFVELIQNTVVILGIPEIFQLARIGKIQNEQISILF